MSQNKVFFKRRQAQGKKIMPLVILLLGVFFISLASASVEKNFIKDEVKSQISTTNYGTYTIKEDNKQIKEIILKDNTDTCSDNCLATKEITNYKKDTLIEDIRFYIKINEEWILYNRFNSWRLLVREKGTVNWTTLNQKADYPIGTFEVKLLGNKEPSISYDWQIKVNGEWLDGWATWGNISTGSQAEVILNSPANNYAAPSSPQTFTCLANNTDGLVSNLSIWNNESGTWKVNQTTLVSDKGQIFNYPPLDSVTGGSYSKKGGFKIYIHQDFYLGGISTKTGSGYQANAFVCNDNLCSIVYATATVNASGVAIFSPPPKLNATNTYSIVVNGTSYTRPFLSGVNRLNNAYFNVTMGQSPATETDDTTQTFDIQNLTIYDISYKNLSASWNVYFARSFIWSCRGCDFTGTCGFAQENRTILLSSVFVGSNIYNATTYQTASESYLVNVTANSSLSGVNLIYDGTSYIATYDDGNWSRILDVDSTASGVKSFYWEFTYAGTKINSSSYNQTVNIINFSLCDTSLTTKFLNLTFKDEVSGSYINATIDSSTFNYWLGGGTTYKTYTFLNTTANYYYQFCASPATVTLHNTASIQYASTGYAQRRQYTSTDMTNVTIPKVLYLLPSGDGIYSVYQVQDQNGNSITGVSVTAERQISGVWYTLESGSTDTAGAVTFWLNPNFDHRLTFIKSGYITETVTIRPSSSTYSVVMTSSTGAGVSGYNSTLASGVTWKFGVSPFTNVLTQNTTYTFWLLVNSTSGNLVAYKMELLDNNSNVISTTTGAVSTGGYVNSTINVFQNKSIRGKYSIDTGDGYVIVDADSFWPVMGMDIPARGTISSFLTNLNRINVFGTDEGRKQYSMALLFFIILFIVLGAICYNTGWDFATTGGALVLLIPVVIIASMAGFFNITYLPPGASDLASAAFIQKYSVAIITTLLGGAYMFNKLAEGRG